MKYKKYKSSIQQKYRKERLKRQQDKDAHIPLMIIVLIVLILYVIALYLGFFDTDPFINKEYLG
ncbi:hypothetical protein ACFFGV_14195 [Pontibacillus salicampi]|uniref:Uncharacterized protein n=1 Tax=Pontibacillus salicampi TaxID=1449801 RepID=A0ABV6LQN0_9BACI